MNLQAYYRWENLPLCLLAPEQQIKFKQQVQTCRYETGEIVWSTDRPGSQFLIISGNVRLREEGKPKSLAILTTGDWIGDLLELSGQFKAVASSKDVVAVRWDAALWASVASPEISQFWRQERSRYQPYDANLPQPVSGYPFVFSPNTAAACLTMVAQHWQNSVQLEWVQRQLRGSNPKDLVQLGERMGLQLQQLEVSWDDLR